MNLITLEKIFCKNVDFGKIQDGRHSGAITQCSLPPPGGQHRFSETLDVTLQCYMGKPSPPGGGRRDDIGSWTVMTSLTFHFRADP